MNTPEGICGWPMDVSKEDFGVYQPRRMGFVGHWLAEDWAIKVYGIQSQKRPEASPLLDAALLDAAREHTFRLLSLTSEEGAFYKTGFAVLHEGRMANWLLFQWWTHQDVWCQLLSYSTAQAPLAFKYSTRPVRACVYETAIIWHEQKAWIRRVLNGAPDRKAYLEDVMLDEWC